MSEKLSLRKMIPVIVITWILSFATTLAFIYLAPLVPIDTDKINDSAITSSKIADEAIITTKLPDGSVTSAKILDGAIVAQDLADGSITTVKVAGGTITTTKIADSAVTSAKIADTAIVSVKLADGAVTTAKILDGTITAEDLATGAVASIKIADGAVTASKIADYAVTNTKLALGAIPYNSTHVINIISTSSTNWQNMSDTSVSLHLARTSHVLIMFSASSRLTSMITPATMYVRAMIGDTIANPDTGASFISTIGSPYECSAFVFYLPNVNPGTYTVYIQWTVTSPGVTAYVNERTLNVFALPA
jgi:hypothetical protein